MVYYLVLAFKCNINIQIDRIRYAEMGNTMPTTSGKTPVLPPYWAKNQVLLYADNGRYAYLVIPPISPFVLFCVVFFLFFYFFGKKHQD